ncbi:40S ribosomal protein S12 [Rhynchospora pubera]|uniref:40S ribosomal protein S12 n=1 Tax=Rhynchospora pubera TaxID=906938 RepID=A0AAV8C8D9_9POAL|nr:40S ribosomal protein S12 [Rhynchospora pubera]
MRIVESPAAKHRESMDLRTALRSVMKKAAAHDGLANGLCDGAKAIVQHVAALCILVEDCDQSDYVKLIEALCVEHNVHPITVPVSKIVGEWAGLRRVIAEGRARKVVGCSCHVIKDHGAELEGSNIVK